jgi:fructose-bisphosphate aldolase class I
MHEQLLKETVTQLFAGEKGLLAMDESTSTSHKRFAAAGIAQTVEMRRRYREWIVTTPGLNQSIADAILYDETMRQQTKDGIPFREVLIKAGIIPGIKVDRGAVPMPGFAGEKVTEGLDGLRNRLDEYKALGARFAKWRGVIAIGAGMPGRACIEANAHALARYAAFCQEAGMVPMVEPEVLMEGNHPLPRCFDVTREVKSPYLVHKSIFSDGTKSTKAHLSTQQCINSPRKCMRMKSIRRRGDALEAQ